MEAILPILNEPNAIHLGFNMQSHIAKDLFLNTHCSTYVLITDTNLLPLIQPLLAEITDQCPTRFLLRIIPPGEGSKSRETKADIEDYLLRKSCTRDTCLIAVGGGVVGDLVGYVAATFMRGIPFVQIPTTLLSMVDSSIGGKTAIDPPAGKNLIGAFWQPKRIYMDLGVLMTLPTREFRNGMAEVIKTAAISSEKDFIVLEESAHTMEESLHSPESKQALLSVIMASSSYKARVVTEDERETGLRGLLNFGHTIGHAFEKILSPSWLHGECVAVGLVAETQVALRMGHCTQDTLDRIIRVLKAYGLPCEFDAATKERLHLDQVMHVMKVDKKNQGHQKKLVLLSSIGTTLEQKASSVPDSFIEEIVKGYVSLGHSTPLEEYVPMTLTHTIALWGDTRVQAWLTSALLPHAPYVTLQSENSSGIHINVTRELSTSNNGSYEYYYIALDDTEASALLRFIQSLITPTPTPTKETQYTRFVTPTVSDYESLSPALVEQWLEEAHVIEFRVDLLNPTCDWITTAACQLAHLRRALTRPLPIIYTVRTLPQAGRFTDKHVYTELVGRGYRWGCAFIDMEAMTVSWEDLQKTAALGRQLAGHSSLIISFHDPHREHPWTDVFWTDLHAKCLHVLTEEHQSGVIKLVGYAHSLQDNIDLEIFRRQIEATDSGVPLIALNMGEQGRLSRVLNRFLSPVTHTCLPTAAAPGQLTAQQIAAVVGILFQG
ncbi:3-dehydroquinate synthase-domain-containing protein [Spinellus fusiger]|nr:3-dehydroquinate synthase-domain-containing protein [Spinellus fusiger]